MTKLLIIHGPNLNLLGEREPEVYGGVSLAEINRRLREYAEAATLARSAGLIRGLGV